MRPDRLTYLFGSAIRRAGCRLKNWSQRYLYRDTVRLMGRCT
jgi:hypothetical protein